MILWINIKIKRCPFHHWGWECKSRKSRDTWSNRKFWPWTTKWSRAKVNRVLPRAHSSDGQYWNQIDYILCSPRWRSYIQSAKTRLGADCGSDHELLIAKFRLKLKKVVKATRPFRYDLNQISYDYTVEMTDRFKGLDLIDRVPEELWTENHNTVQEVVTKNIPNTKKCKKTKWFSEETGEIAEKRRERKGKGEREKYSQLNAEVQRIASLMWIMQKNRGKQ